MPLQINEVEVIVLRETTFNGPDHRTLGDLHPGDRVITSAGLYANWLVENGFAAFISDFDGAIASMEELDEQLKQAEVEKVDEIAPVKSGRKPKVV